MKIEKKHELLNNTYYLNVGSLTRAIEVSRRAEQNLAFLALEIWLSIRADKLEQEKKGQENKEER